jgi:hypothetical protein
VILTSTRIEPAGMLDMYMREEVVEWVLKNRILWQVGLVNGKVLRIYSLADSWFVESAHYLQVSSAPQELANAPDMSSIY